MRIAVISAMESEISALIQVSENCECENLPGMKIYLCNFLNTEVVLAVSGEGKVNAAMCTQTVIILYNPDCVINLGIAGGVKTCMKMGDVIIGTDTVQHDFDVTPLGYERGRVCNLDVTRFPCDSVISDALYKSAVESANEFSVYRGTVATGDMFISCDKKMREIDSVFDAYAAEMEAASIAQVCYINKVPFAVVRSVSDNGGDSAFSDFKKFADYAAQTSVKIITSYLKNI